MGDARHAHRHRHVGSLPSDPFSQYGRRNVFVIGMIHGIGAETPTQISIFLAATGAGGRGTGLLLLGCFVIGLLLSNSVVALAGTLGFVGAGRNFAVYASVSVVTAGFSLAVGSALLLGHATSLPTLLGG